MKTRKIKTINYFLRNCNQATIQQIFNGRIHHNKFGWINIKISENLKETILNDIKNYLSIKDISENKETFNHWFFNRMFYSNYGKCIEIDYSPGQDQDYEFMQIKRHIKNNI